MAVGYWKSPTEATYLATNDASQNQRLEGMPFGTRGGIVARHDFPADGEYKFSIQNFGVGSYVPNEQLVLLIDGERAHVWPYKGVGVNVGMTADADGTLEVTVPVRAGSRLVGATFLATNYRPSLDIIRHYDRKSLENNTIPQLQNYPAIGFVRIQGPFNAERPADSASRRKILTCGAPSTGRLKAAERAMRAADPHDAGAARLPPAADAPRVDEADGVLRRGRKAALRRRHRAGAAPAARQPAVPRARRARAGHVAAGQTTASPISSWPRGCRSSCGAAFPTTR
jgi:hypothetical protein